MSIRVLVVAVLCVVGLVAGAVITSALRTPTRTIVKPIELRDAPEVPNEPDKGKKPHKESRKSQGSDAPVESVPDPSGDPSNDGQVIPPAPVPGTGEDDPVDDDDGEGTDDGETDDDGSDDDGGGDD